MSLPHSILLYGDPYLAKNKILEIKKKFSSNSSWQHLSLKTDKLDFICSEVCAMSFGNETRFFILEDFSIKTKDDRSFLIRMAKDHSEDSHVILFDSKSAITIDPKTNLPNKTAKAFIKEFKEIDNCRSLNMGSPVDEANQGDIKHFIKHCFEKHDRQISDKLVGVLISIVGYDKGLLYSDIEKLCMIAPKTITHKFILDNAFPTSKESLLYKLSNILDTGSHKDSILMIDRLVKSGFEPTQISYAMCQKIRTQLAISYYWTIDLSYGQIKNALMNMGKFPAALWHSNKYDNQDKKNLSAKYNSVEAKQGYLKKRGLCSWHFKSHGEIGMTKAGDLKKVRSSTISHPYVAECAIKFFQKRVLTMPSDGTGGNYKKMVFDKVLHSYLKISDKTFSVRKNDHPLEDLYAICRIICDIGIIDKEYSYGK